MFFRRKGWLREEFDENLIKQLNHLKENWDRQNRLQEKSFDPFVKLNCKRNYQDLNTFFY